MDYCNKIKTAINLLGNDYKDCNKTISLTMLSYIILILTLCTSCSLFLISNWNCDSKILSVKSITFFIILLSHVSVYLVCWNDFITAVAIIVDEDSKKFPFILTNERKALMESKEKQLMLDSKYLYSIVIFNVIVVYVVPLLGTIYIILTTDNLKRIKIEKLPLPYPVYYPLNYKNLYMYFLYYILQSLYMTLSGILGYLLYIVSISSMQIIIGDIKLLCLSINEIDTFIFPDKNISTKCHNHHLEKCNLTKLYEDDYIENISFSKNEFRMVYYLKFIIESHQLIYSKIQLINKGIQGVSMVLKCGAYAYGFMSIYYIVERNDVLSKIIEASLCAFLFYALYVFDERGEQVTTEWKNLRNALYQYNWVNKSNFFKKMLLIVITRNNKPIEIKPYGLFVLNLRNFAMTSNTIYSYFNILNNFKEK